MRHGQLFILSILTSMMGCDGHECEEGSHPELEIFNQSDQTVNWIWDDNPNDSIWRLNGSSFPDIDRGLLNSNQTEMVAAGLEGCWEYHFMGGHHEYYFFFDHDTVSEIGWAEIHGTNRGLLKRVWVDSMYLENNEFTITYP